MKRLVTFVVIILSLPNIAFAVSFKAHITRKGTNRPAAQALIVFVSTDGVEKARSITGDDGLCFIHDIPSGTYLVTVSYRDQVKEYPNFVVGPDPTTYDFDI